MLQATIDKYKMVDDFSPVEAIKESRVLLSEHIQSSDIVFGVLNMGEITRVCTRGNISCIIGKAKSRKTFFITLVCASIILGDIAAYLYGKLTNKIVIFDTEQGRWHVQQVIKRIIKLTGCCEDKIEIFSLRKYSPSQRWQVIDHYFKTNSPDFAVIDGIRDLISDINNADQATEISTQIMKWSEEKNCHIMNVLHMNKGDNNARGHLGSEIVNKSESVLEISKEEQYSKVEAGYMRGLDFEPIYFEVIDNLPYLKSEGVSVISDKPTKRVPF